MEELTAVNEQIRMVKGNIQMYLLLMIIVSIGGGILSYYELKEINSKHQTILEQLEIKNPEAATSR